MATKSGRRRRRSSPRPTLASNNLMTCPRALLVDSQEFILHIQKYCKFLGGPHYSLCVPIYRAFLLIHRGKRTAEGPIWAAPHISRDVVILNLDTSHLFLKRPNDTKKLLHFSTKTSVSPMTDFPKVRGTIWIFLF